MKQFELQEKTISLFMLAYDFWSFQDFIGETKETPLGIKLEKVFKKRFGSIIIPSDKGKMKRKFGIYKPSKAAFALFPGRFEYKYEEIRVSIATLLQRFYICSSKEPWEVFNNINYKKMYYKLCKFFMENITKEEIDYLENGEELDWWEDPEYASKFLYGYLKQLD